MADRRQSALVAATGAGAGAAGAAAAGAQRDYDDEEEPQENTEVDGEWGMYRDAQLRSLLSPTA